jgi:dipeptidyl aminopeptidase/acylaminoacyl peptidase
LEASEILSENSQFTRYLVSYPSDGLQIYGFMNVPVGEGPFPVVIASHGYIDPGVYQTLDYTTNYADELARNGYLVLHPNLRGYPPSEDGPNLFRVGMAIDVLNLIALVEAQAGRPGPLAQADASRIGLWGHSMGGGISTRVMTVNPDVDAVLLYGAMSGDEQQNFERILNVFSEGQRGLEELSAPPEALQRISPIYYLDGVEAAVSIHHGSGDAEVPLEWSIDLCDRLEQLNKSVECFTYEAQPHTFSGEGDLLFIFRMVDFFDRFLKANH